MPTLQNLISAYLAKGGKITKGQTLHADGALSLTVRKGL